MTGTPKFLSPWSWTNQDLTLYHGTLEHHVKMIKSRVDVTLGNPLTDFGRGFYTTTSRRQARSWAWQLAVDYNVKQSPHTPAATPVVIRYRVSRDDLAGLECLTFVRGDFHAEDYWSLVHHCRSGNPGHARPAPPAADDWYDVVAGPVAAVWRTRLAVLNADQYSFHTQAGADVLDASKKRVEEVAIP